MRAPGGEPAACIRVIVRKQATTVIGRGDAGGRGMSFHSPFYFGKGLSSQCSMTRFTSSGFFCCVQCRGRSIRRAARLGATAALGTAHKSTSCRARRIKVRLEGSWRASAGHSDNLASSKCQVDCVQGDRNGVSWLTLAASVGLGSGEAEASPRASTVRGGGLIADRLLRRLPRCPGETRMARS